MNAIHRVGFIGLGAMGAPMAGHLYAKDMLAAVGNRTPAKAEALAAQLGVTAAMTPSDFAGCDAVVLCVSMDADVMQCCRDLAGVLAAGTLVIDHSTVARETALAAAALLAESGIASRADVEFAQNAGANAILVGEALVTSGDTKLAMRKLLGQG